MSSAWRIEALSKPCLILAILAALRVSQECASAAQHDGSPKTDAIVLARVNGEAVTRAELHRVLASPFERRQLLKERGIQNGEPKNLDRLLLRKLIQRRLLLQEAGRRHFVVTDKDLDQAITALRRSFHDLGSFGAWMKEQGVDEKTLFEITRAEMLVAKVRASLVAPVRVSEAQTRAYYDDHKEDLKTEEVRIQLIVVKEEKEVDEILAALQKGADFGALARERSQGVRAPQGGDAGWIDAETLWPPLREAVASLKAREARGPLKRGDEFLIVRLEGRRPGRAKSLAAARPEIERRLLPAAQQGAVQAWLARQEKQSRIEVFADTISRLGHRNEHATNVATGR